MEPQLIPPGELVTNPNEARVPVLVTERGKVVVEVLKVAVTAVPTLAATVQESVPEQAPDQPAKAEPAVGAAVRVTVLPLAKLAEHVAPQLIPAGELLTVPLPVPALVTVSEKVVEALKVAVTVVAAFSVTVHVPVPEQGPLQPAKVEPAAGVAVRATTAPVANGAEQLDPQLIPAGALVTVPEPAPPLATESMTGADWAKRIA
jgi:hypothetical protein